MDNVPELRFSEFSGEWEISRLDLLFNISAGGDIDSTHVSYVKDEKYKYPIYANAKKNKGFYGYSDIYKFEGGVITIAGRGVHIGIAHTRIHRFYPIVRLLVLSPKINLDVNFFEYEINRLKLFLESTGVPQLTSPQASGYSVRSPSLPEQQKIATFLSAVDKKLGQLRRKHELLESYKRGIMQKIFSQELRFKQDNSADFPDWEYRELGEILDYEQPTKYLVSSTEYDNQYRTPVLTAGKTFILGFTDETNGIYEEKLPVIIFDDFTTANKYVDFSFKAKSSAMKMLTCRSENSNIKFIFEFMKLLKFPLGEHKRYWISEYQYLAIPYPHPVEQQKIANFLSTLDKKLEAVQEQIDQTEVFKKGLLQKMFV